VWGNTGMSEDRRRYGYGELVELVHKLNPFRQLPEPKVGANEHNADPLLV
jgi:hypothetical protein